MSDEVVHVALGSNLGDRGRTLDAAVAAIRGLANVHLLAESRRRETDALLPPENPTPQPRYLNSVIAVQTTLAPRALLDELQRIERQLGRTTSTRWAPRVIDLDIVLWGDRVIHEDVLDVPHPELHLRRFVLVPLAELAPDAVHPGLHKTVRELLDAMAPP